LNRPATAVLPQPVVQRQRRHRRLAWWISLFRLLGVALTLLVALTVRHQDSRVFEEMDLKSAVELANRLRDAGT
jgi:hypothetical protein